MSLLSIVLVDHSILLGHVLLQTVHHFARCSTVVVYEVLFEYGGEPLGKSTLTLLDCLDKIACLHLKDLLLAALLIKLLLSLVKGMLEFTDHDRFLLSLFLQEAILELDLN